MTLGLALLLALSLGNAGDASDPQAEESVLTTYDLRTILPRWDASTDWQQTLLVVPLTSPQIDRSSIDQSLSYSELASLELLDLLNQVLGDELRREGRELSVENEKLSVLAPASVHEQVRAVLDGLEAVLAGTIPLRVDVLTLGEGGGELPPAGALSDDEANKLVTALVGRGAQQRTFPLELSAGRTARLDSFRRVPFLYDYDVEVAQAIAIFGPVMSETRDGTRIAVRGVGIQGGLSLSVLLMRSELLGKIEKKPLRLAGMINLPEKGPLEELPGPDGIQTPEVQMHSLAFDTFLPDGKALALTLETSLGSARTREVVLLRRSGGSTTSFASRPIPRTNRTLIAVNAEIFKPPHFTIDASPESDEYETYPNVLASLDAGLSDFLLEWMKARFSIWRSFGPWILIVTDPSWDRDSAAQLDRLVKGLRPATTLTTVGMDLRAPGETPFPVRLRVPVLRGSQLGAVLGRGTTAVTHYDVEVAQGAAVPDPWVSPVFDGLAASVAVGATGCEVSGMALLHDSAAMEFETGYALMGPLARPEARTLRFDERFQLPQGRSGPLRIGAGSDRPDPAGLGIELSVQPGPR